MKTTLLTVTAAVCLMGFGTLSFADEMSTMKGGMKGQEMKGEMKAKPDEMKAQKGEMKTDMHMKKNEMNGEIKAKKDEMKGGMKGAMGY